MKLEIAIKQKLQDALIYLVHTKSHIEVVEILKVLIDENKPEEEFKALIPRLKTLADSSDESSSDAAQWLYGFCCWNGIGINKEQKIGFEYITLAAYSTFAPAHHTLGDFHCSGNNDVSGLLIQNQKLGFGLHKRALKNGYIDSAATLFCLYKQGQAVEKNIKLALYYANKMLEAYDFAANKDLSIFSDELAQFYEFEKSINDSQKSLEYYEISNISNPLCRSNNVRLFNLYVCYRDAYGTEINVHLAALLIQSSILKNDQVSKASFEEWTTKENLKFPALKDAIQLYQNAVSHPENPDPFAEYALGFCNLMAIGMDQNLNVASEYFKKSIQHGETCYRHLYLCYREMLKRGMPVLENLKELYKTIEMVATQGNTNKTSRYFKRRSRLVPFEANQSQDKKTAVETKISSELVRTAMKDINLSFSAVNEQLQQLIYDINSRMECASLYAYLNEKGAPGLTQNITYALKFYEIIKELMNTQDGIISSYPKMKSEFIGTKQFAFHCEQMHETPANNYAKAKTEFYTPMLELTVYVSGSLKDIMPEKSIAETIAEYSFDP